MGSAAARTPLGGAVRDPPPSCSRGETAGTGGKAVTAPALGAGPAESGTRRGGKAGAAPRCACVPPAVRVCPQLCAPGITMLAGSGFLTRPCLKRIAGCGGRLCFSSNSFGCGVFWGGRGEETNLEEKQHPSLGRGRGKGKQRVWQKNHQPNQPLVALSNQGHCWDSESGSPSSPPSNRPFLRPLQR